jgi:hypothetical protein
MAGQIYASHYCLMDISHNQKLKTVIGSYTKPPFNINFLQARPQVSALERAAGGR